MIKRVIICGAGNSIIEGLEKNLWKKIKGQNIWSLNYAFMTMPYLPKREIWVDVKFFMNNTEELQKLKQKGVPLFTRYHRRYAELRDKIVLYNSSREIKNYFGKDSVKKNTIYYGRMGLVGMFGLTMAIAEGYNEIFLLGYDFGNDTLDNKNTHYYQGKLNIKSTGMGFPSVYRSKTDAIKREVDDFKVYLREKDVKIWNVSIPSNIPFFSKISYEEFYKKVKDV